MKRPPHNWPKGPEKQPTLFHETAARPGHFDVFAISDDNYPPDALKNVRQAIIDQTPIGGYIVRFPDNLPEYLRNLREGAPNLTGHAVFLVQRESYEPLRYELAPPMSGWGGGGKWPNSPRPVPKGPPPEGVPRGGPLSGELLTITHARRRERDKFLYVRTEIHKPIPPEEAKIIEDLEECAAIVLLPEQR